MLGSMLNYTPSIGVGPVSTALPQQLAGLSQSAPRSAQQQAFNLPAYMRGSTSQGQWNEMNTANQNRYRASLGEGQSHLGRQMQQANTGQMMSSLGAANNASNQYSDIMSNAIQGDRTNQANWYSGLSDLAARRQQTFGPMLGSLFGGAF